VDERLVVAGCMRAELGAGVLGLVVDDELAAVEGAVVLEEFEAAHAGAEASEHGAALVGLDEDVDLAATLHIGDRLGAVAIDGVGALRLDDLVDEGLKLAALAGVGMRGDIEPLGEVAEQFAAADVALEVDAALSVDLHAAVGGEGVVFVAALDAGIGRAERGVGERHDEEARGSAADGPGEATHVAGLVGGLEEERALAGRDGHNDLEGTRLVEQDRDTVDRQRVAKVGAAANDDLLALDDEPLCGQVDLQVACR